MARLALATLCTFGFAAACTGAPESGTVDGGAAVDSSTGSDDAAQVCPLGQGTSSGRRIRVVYLVPSDRAVNPQVTANLELAINDVRQWLRARTPRGTSFRLADPVVEVVQTDTQADSYATTDSGNENPDLWFWDNVVADAFAATGATFDDPDNRWLFYVEADPTCGQISGAFLNGVAVLDRNDLRGLLGEPRVPRCPDGQPDDFGRCRWVGGMANLLVRALGVPTPPTCTDDDASTPCDADRLTWTGYQVYPDAELSEDELTLLDQSEFMTASGLPDCQLDCDTMAD